MISLRKKDLLKFIVFGNFFDVQSYVFFLYKKREFDVKAMYYRTLKEKLLGDKGISTLDLM